MTVLVLCSAVLVHSSQHVSADAGPAPAGRGVAPVERWQCADSGTFGDADEE